MMRWYLLAVIFLLDEVHLKLAMGYAVDDQLLVKRGFTDDQVKFQNVALAAHNKYRAAHCAPALKLNDKLSQDALDYANTLAGLGKLEHNTTILKFDNNENLYGGNGKTPDGQDVTDAWYSEIDAYDFGKGEFSTTTGHFTQLVWKGTTDVGFGFASNADGSANYVVARYSSAGNYAGEFIANVLKKGSC